MGWSFGYGQTRKGLIEYITKAWTADDGSHTACLTHTARGNVLWSVWERTNLDKSTHRFIACDLMKSEKGYGWGYKGMEESSGPLHYTCPMSYLKMVAVVNQGWREKVIEYHARGKQAIVIGQTVALVGCTLKSARITSIKPLMGIGNDGRRYRIPRRMIGEVIQEDE